MNLPEIVYTPESQLRRPGFLMRGMLRDFRASRELAWRLLVRNISSKYRQTLLGYVWAFLPPLVTALIWVFLNSQGVVDFGDTGCPYALYVMIGTLLWQVFADAIRAPLEMMESCKSMLAKVNLPKEALVLAGVGEVLFSFLVRFVLIVGVLLWFQVPLHLTVLLVPLGILSLVCVGTAVGLLLIPLGLLYKDIRYGLLLMTQLWFYLTPVVYPEPTHFPANLLVKLNPVSPVLISTRHWLTTGQSGDVMGFVIVTAAVFVLMLVGWCLYRIAMPVVIERMGA
jgi:lipopolysaccharide transport system permease protein